MMMVDLNMEQRHRDAAADYIADRPCLQAYAGYDDAVRSGRESHGLCEAFRSFESECMRSHVQEAGIDRNGKIIDVDVLAAALAKSDGVDFNEVCGCEAGGDDCESDTCVARHWEDHDADDARSQYRRYARLAIELIGSPS